MASPNTILHIPFPRPMQNLVSYLPRNTDVMGSWPSSLTLKFPSCWVSLAVPDLSLLTWVSLAVPDLSPLTWVSLAVPDLLSPLACPFACERLGGL